LINKHSPDIDVEPMDSSLENEKLVKTFENSDSSDHLDIKKKRSKSKKKKKGQHSDYSSDDEDQLGMSSLHEGHTPPAPK
jgi:hypothetical protein